MMNILNNKIFNGCYLGKYKIYSVIQYTDTEKEFDIVLEEQNDHIYYSFTFFLKDEMLEDEFYTYRWHNKLYGDNYESIYVEVMSEEIGNDVFESVHNIAIFLVKNGFIS